MNLNIYRQILAAHHNAYLPSRIVHTEGEFVHMYVYRTDLSENSWLLKSIQYLWLKWKISSPMFLLSLMLHVGSSGIQPTWKRNTILLLNHDLKPLLDNIFDVFNKCVIMYCSVISSQFDCLSNRHSLYRWKFKKQEGKTVTA